MSLPARERGLKLVVVYGKAIIVTSLPARERGLKRLPLSGNPRGTFVAPRAGAWIET